MATCSDFGPWDKHDHMMWSVHTSQHYKYSSFFTFNFPSYFPSTQQRPLIGCSWEALFSVSSTWYLFAQFAMRFTSATFCVVHGRHYSVLLELCSLRHAMLNLNLLRWYLNFCWEEDHVICVTGICQVSIDPHPHRYTTSC